MARLNLVFPTTPLPVWMRNDISMFIDNMFFGFGANVVTVVIIGMLGIKTKNVRSARQKSLMDNLFLQFIPALGSCISFLDLFLLWKKIANDSSVMYHEWFAKCSQLLVWISIIFLALRDSWFFIFQDRILSYWWILKYVFWIPRIHRTFFPLDLEVMKFLKESFVMLVDIMLGIYINAIRLNRESSKNRSIEETLLSADMDLEDGRFRYFGIADSLWSLISFQSITQIINLGVTRQLGFGDLLQLPVDMDPSSCHNVLLSCWQDQQSNNHSNQSLFKTICWAYGWPYIKLGLLKVFNDFFGFTGPLLLNKFIKILQQGSNNFDGYIFAISLGLAPILKSFLDTQYSFHLSRIKLRLRSGIMTIIFRKCMRVSLAERSEFSEGEIQTFMSVDADRIVNLCASLHDVWSLPLQIGVALYLLYTQVKFAFVSGVAIIILLIPVNKWISNLIANATQNMMKEKDERIRRTKEFLSFICTLKMYGWESLFTSWLMESRSSEVTHLSTRKYLDAWCVFFWATTPTLFSFSTFGLLALMGHQLDAAMVFTCIALFNTLISPLNSLPWVINGLIDASISLGRVNRFLSFPEHKRALELTAKSASLSSSKNGFNDTVVIIRDACCSWSGRNDDTQHMVLNLASLCIPKGSFVAIIGEVGSGKSSLLNSILGEMRLIYGSICSSGSISYVPQFPWIISGTVRDNVLFGIDYNRERYYDVMQSCALDVDVSLMVGGDMALIGEKGANLSGGQRARLALARAIYHGSDIFLLDDVLSAVDAQVGEMILKNAILGPLMGQHTRILCTHNIQAISSASHIVVMDKGCIKWMGNLTEFSVCSYSTLFFQELALPCSVESRDITNTTTNVSQELFKDDVANVSQVAANVTEVELRKEGMVEFSVYRSYAAFIGLFVTVIICLSAVLMQASRNGNDLWISHWVDSTTGSSRIQPSVSFYLVGLCIFCMLNSVFTLVRAFSFAFGGLQAATQVHNTLLNKLSNAPVQFFDQTLSGRILNRMSSDLYTIDDSLPFILNILLANLVGILGTAIILSYVQVIFLLLLLPFWFVYNKLQFYYRSTSRELRRLDSVARSPIYTSFAETLDGSATIRAFKFEDIFFARFIEHVEMYQRTSYSELTASLWLSLRLQLLAALVISFFAIMAMIGSRSSLRIGFGTPGMVGLALSYSSPFVSLLGSFLSSFTETEKEMVSLERLIQYMEIPQEEHQEHQHLSPNWPYDGVIKFQNVTLKYSPSLPPALHNISFTLAGGTQNGIVGRTGAGKSSILSALFRLFPLSGGRIIVDGINVADVSVRDFRARIAVVPQTPFLFEGSLRDNLDPFHQNDDFKIWSVVEKCCVKDKVEAAGGLDMHILESGTSFSVGQRQLLCLARALLKSSKVLCLDECTANIDNKTSLVLKHAISSVCRGVTVITIAHRISTVLNMDNILIFDLGNLVEQGNPEVLLQDQSSRFSSFAKASKM